MMWQRHRSSEIGQSAAVAGRAAILRTASRRVFVLGTLAAPMIARPTMAGPSADLVPVQLDGRPARLLLDTGATRSILTLTAVRRLGLKSDGWVDTLLRGAGGRLESHANADVAQARFGSVRLFQRPGQTLSFSVTSMYLGMADGLLGGDILRHFDIAVGSSGDVNLNPAGQTPATARDVRLGVLFPDLLLVPVTLDGQSLTALLDTGATTSLLNARGLHKMGRSAAGAPSQIQALGGPASVQSHQFERLTVGPETISNPTLLAAAVPEAAFDLILGLDVIGRGAFGISYARRTLTL